MRFLSDLPSNTKEQILPGSLQAKLDKGLKYGLGEANNIFNDMFGSNLRAPFRPVKHDKTKRLGYNQGLNKATFATAFDRKEYFERVIRPDNKKHLIPGIQANRHEKNKATFIEYDKKKRQNFKEMVQSHLDNINKEEKEEHERLRREQRAASAYSKS